ncbi:unnamed protein product [Calicophoron daubneyi]|uniref:DNA polymerase eta n=1 Tax=Calicophoron daubneyi TaxID=300641 RepID=A0AAV2T8Q5_CALDB
MDRIILLVDMDCFYVQVEQRERPDTKGKPCGVAQYNGTTGGGLIAVSYEAREKGIKRGMYRKVALEKCPDLIVFEVPEKRGKADLTRYRSAGAEVIECMSELLNNVEKASIDEAFIDLTDAVAAIINNPDNISSVPTDPNSESFVVVQPGTVEALNDSSNSNPSSSLNRKDWMAVLERGFSSGRQYGLASALAYKVRQAILAKTGFQCSAGIAPNKTLAKLACSLNKPNKQTIVPPESVSFLLCSTPINKIRNLGGKLGSAVMERFSVQTLGQLAEISLSDLEKEFGSKSANWLYQLCRGYDSESVTPRSVCQSVGCSKNFVGRAVLTSTNSIKHWLRCLASELIERLTADRQENQRQATRLTMYVRTADPLDRSTIHSNGFSRVLPSCLLRSVGAENKAEKTIGEADSSTPSTVNEISLEQKIADAALGIMQEVFFSDQTAEAWNPGITGLGFCAGKFCPTVPPDTSDIRTLLMNSEAANKRSPPPIPSSSSPAPSACGTQQIVSPHSYTGEDHMSFFKKLRVVEVSAPPTENTAASLFAEQTVADMGGPASSDDPLERSEHTAEPPVDHDPDSRSSMSNEPSAFFTCYTAGDWTVCDQCGSRVSVWQLPEHMDFHLAQRLQNEWSKEQASTSTSNTHSSSSSRSAAVVKPHCSSTSSQAASGRGRIRARGSSKSKSVCTLDRFISRPTTSFPVNSEGTTPGGYSYGALDQPALAVSSFGELSTDTDKISYGIFVSVFSLQTYVTRTWFRFQSSSASRFALHEWFGDGERRSRAIILRELIPQIMKRVLNAGQFWVQKHSDELETVGTPTNLSQPQRGDCTESPIYRDAYCSWLFHPPVSFHVGNFPLASVLLKVLDIRQMLDFDEDIIRLFTFNTCIPSVNAVSTPLSAPFQFRMDKAFKKRNICPTTCSCTSGSLFTQRPVCRPGVPVIRDECDCCWMCARQPGESCSSRFKCDQQQDLECFYNPTDSKKISSLMGNPSPNVERKELTLVPPTTDAVGSCWKKGGRACLVNGTWLPHSGVIRNGCRHQCVCVDGMLLCTDLCYNQEQARPPEILCRTSVDSGVTMQLQLIRPTSNECCARWMCVPMVNGESSEEDVGYQASENVSEKGLEEKPRNTPDTCTNGSSQWTRCTHLCGLGLSFRWTTETADCQNVTQVRLCFWRPCHKVKLMQNSPFVPTLKFARPGYLRFATDDLDLSSPMNFTSRSTSHRNGNSTYSSFSTSGSAQIVCQLQRPVRPKFCNEPGPDHCCWPERSKTRRLRFQCTGGRIVYYFFEWIQSCSCVRTTCAKLLRN